MRVMTSTITSTTRETTLLRAAAAGDPHASGLLYQRHWPALARTCERVTGCPMDAADAAQDAMLATLRRLPELDLATMNFAAYLHTAGRRAALKRVGGRARTVALDTVIDPADPGAGVPEGLERDELRRAVRGAMRELPARQRTALFQSAYEGRALLDIGEALGLSANATAQLVHRARRGLAEQLTRHDAGLR